MFDISVLLGLKPVFIMKLAGVAGRPTDVVLSVAHRYYRDEDKMFYIRLIVLKHYLSFKMKSTRV